MRRADIWAVLTLVVLAGCGTPGEDLPAEKAEMPEALDVRAQVQRQGQLEYATGGDTRWVRTFNVGSFFGSTVRELAYDSDGNLVVVGDLRGSIEGLPGATASIGRPGTFVAKFGRGGELKWARGFDLIPGTFPTGGEDEPFARPLALATDREGNIVIAGLKNGDVDFGGGPRSGSTFLVKLDEDGEHVWSRGYGASETSFTVEDLATDSSGDIVLAVSSLLGVDLGEGPLTAPPGASTVVKLSHAGRLKWVRFSEPGVFYSSIAVDENEQLYLGGGASTGELVPLLEKLSPRGERRWARLLEGARGNIIHVAAGRGRVAAVGGLALPYAFPGFTFRGAPGALATPGDFFRGFLVTYSTSGARRWARAAGMFPAGVSLDSRGGVTVGGSHFLGDDLGFGPVFSTPPGLGDYVAKYDADDGDTRWVRLVPLVRDVTSARDGRVGVGGVFSDTVDLGEGPVTGGPGANLYLLDLSR